LQFAAPAAAPPIDGGRETPIVSAKELESFERENIIRALTACRGKISGDKGAAGLLGVPPSTLSSRMKALRIQRSA
jgi:transcriptional regulator with GAF, ATPase, and Fis domain